MGRLLLVAGGVEAVPLIAKSLKIAPLERILIAK
jgi:hypothetical protein